MAAEKYPFAKFLKHFPKGTVLFNEGDEGEDMYIIQSGKVAIKKRVPHGETTLAVLEKGDFFGEMAMLERMPRSASAEMAEDGDLIVIGSDVFGDMIKANPEIAVRMMRKYSIRLRETTKQIEQLAAAGGVAARTRPRRSKPPTAGHGAGRGAGLLRLHATPATCSRCSSRDSLIGRYDSVTGMSPEIDLTNEDQSRNISRRHARLVIKDGKHFIAEEIGTMNGTFLNGQKLAERRAHADQGRRRADALPPVHHLQDPRRPLARPPRQLPGEGRDFGLGRLPVSAPGCAIRSSALPAAMRTSGSASPSISCKWVRAGWAAGPSRPNPCAACLRTRGSASDSARSNTGSTTSAEARSSVRECRAASRTLVWRSEAAVTRAGTATTAASSSRPRVRRRLHRRLGLSLFERGDQGANRGCRLRPEGREGIGGAPRHRRVAKGFHGAATAIWGWRPMPPRSPRPPCRARSSADPRERPRGSAPPSRPPARCGRGFRWRPAFPSSRLVPRSRATPRPEPRPAPSRRGLRSPARPPARLRPRSARSGSKRRPRGGEHSAPGLERLRRALAGPRPRAAWRGHPRCRRIRAAIG